MANKKHLIVICPCCQAELRLDPDTGLVLNSQAKKPDYSFEGALQREADRKSKADQVFADAFRKEQDRHSTLQEKFRKALESKDELDDPDRPFDFD